jgi:hypothetical protein
VAQVNINGDRVDVVALHEPQAIPTTTSVASSASSTLILAANTERKALSVCNLSTAVLYMSFSNPATTANCFVAVPAGGFLVFDEFMVAGNAIYGIWAAANGTAQVTEYV